MAHDVASRLGMVLGINKDIALGINDGITLGFGNDLEFAKRHDKIFKHRTSFKQSNTIKSY